MPVSQQTPRRPDLRRRNATIVGGSPNQANRGTDDPILFQTYFKSVGPRTYAAQVKAVRNGNRYLVLTEGKRDEKTGELRKIRLFVYGEDFDAFINLMCESATWIKTHPLPRVVMDKRRRYWQRRDHDSTPPQTRMGALRRNQADHPHPADTSTTSAADLPAENDRPKSLGKGKSAGKAPCVNAT